MCHWNRNSQPSRHITTVPESINYQFIMEVPITQLSDLHCDQVVSVLTFSSNNPSLNPAEVFLSHLSYEREKYKKLPGYAHLQKALQFESHHYIYF